MCSKTIEMKVGLQEQQNDVTGALSITELWNYNWHFLYNKQNYPNWILEGTMETLDYFCISMAAYVPLARNYWPSELWGFNQMWTRNVLLCG